MTTDNGTIQPAGFTLSTDEPSGSGFGDSPLQDFWGTGVGFEIRGGTGKARMVNGVEVAGNPWQRPYFNFTNVEVLETTDPYPFPTAQISIFYSDPTKSAKRQSGQGINDWEALSESLRDLGFGGANGFNELFGGQVFQEGQQPASQGKRMRWKRLPCLLRVGPNETNAKWHDEVVNAWRIVEVEGVGKWKGWTGEGTVPASNGNGAAMAGGENLLEYVLGLADGKSEDAFYAAALDDPKVLGNPGLVVQLTGRQIIEPWVTQGRLSRDSAGVLSKVGV